MLAIGRALMTNPKLAHPRRGDRRSRAADPRGDLGLPEAPARRAAIDPGHRQERRRADAFRRPARDHRKGPLGLDGHERRTHRPIQASRIDISTFERSSLAHGQCRRSTLRSSTTIGRAFPSTGTYIAAWHADAAAYRAKRALRAGPRLWAGSTPPPRSLPSAERR